MIKDLLLLLKSKGISLEIKNDRLSARGDQRVLSDPVVMDLLRENRDAIYEMVCAEGPFGGQDHAFFVAPNLIPQGATRLTPQMLTLVELDQAGIDAIVARVDGGAANVQDIYPLAPLQEGILFHHLMEAAGDAYLLPSVVGFATRARLDRFLAALQRVVDRHDILRTGFEWQDLEQPVQVVRRKALLPVQEVVFGTREDVQAQLEAHIDPRQRRLDVRQAPLMHGWVARDEAHDRWLLGMLVHHLAIDHTTLDIMVAEALAIDAGRESQLAAPAPFRNFVAQARLGVSVEEHEAFFKKMLGDIDEPTAPYGVLDVQGDGADVDEVRQVLAPELAQRVRRQARRLGVSAASVMHLAWALVLARVTGRRDVVFGTVLFGRMRGGDQADRGMGMFINTLPVRLRVDTQSVGESLKQVQALLVQLLHHEHAPLALAQRSSGVQAPAPLFTALLNCRHSAAAQEGQGGFVDAEDGIEMLSGHERTNYPLTLSVDDLGEGFALTVQARRPVPADRLCAYMHRAIEGLLDAAEGDVGKAVAGIDILPADERALVLHGWNATRADYPHEKCLHELFEEQVRRTPDAVALVHGEEQLSYAELNARANQLARHLGTLGVGPDQRVALCVDRGSVMVVGLLGVLKAGAAYVPLDPSYVSVRLLDTLQDSRPHLLLLDAKGRAALGAVDVPVVDLHEDTRWTHASPNNLCAKELGVSAHHLAYVIYTSGSTGRPKGVMVEHGNVARLFSATKPWFDFGPHDTWSLFHSFSFDFSVWEIWGALLHGGRLLVVPLETARSPQAFYELLCDERVTVLNQTPSAFLQLLAAQRDSDRAHQLRHVIFGGEALELRTLKRWYDRRSNDATRLCNMYGITETTVHVTHRALDAVDAQHVGASLIGKPIPDLRIYILDEHRRPVPVGVQGELYVGGAGVARGYLNQPELTAERFLLDPFSAATGARMYKTGDLGRWLADGSIEYLGRNDFQVKIRGFRIELGEIEAQLSQVPEAHDVIVLARRDDGGDKKLVAYYAGEAQPQALREHALATLPQYMVPAAYVRMQHWPLTPNGKLDRKALPAPEGDSHVRRGYEAPEGEVEETLAAIWSELLKIDRVSRHDNFFELGGHSLLAVSLIERMRRTDLHVDVRTLFTASSLAELATSTTRSVEILL